MVLKYRQLDFNPKYYISNKGFVISLVRGFTILKGRVGKEGYTRVYIRDKSTNKRKDYKLHRLVAEYFIKNPKNLPCVNHIDGNKMNNKIENLEWVTHSENNIHAYKTGLNHSKKYKVQYGDVVYESKTEASIALNVSRKTIDNWIRKGIMTRR